MVQRNNKEKIFHQKMTNEWRNANLIYFIVGATSFTTK